MTATQSTSAVKAAQQYASLSKQLSLGTGSDKSQHGRGVAVQANFITPLDPVIETATGDRLPAVPLEEAHRLNALKEKVDNHDTGAPRCDREAVSEENRGTTFRLKRSNSDQLDLALPRLETHPLFPPLPLYGPPTLLRNAQCRVFRITSFCLSTAFLLVIVLGAVFTSIPALTRRLWLRMTFRDDRKSRPFYQEEIRRAAARAEEEALWSQKLKRASRKECDGKRATAPSSAPRNEYEPLEGGPDKLLCDARYYARRVGLDMEVLKVETEDSFILDLWHLYDPAERQSGPAVPIDGHRRDASEKLDAEPSVGARQRKRYPVLLVHGLLQSAGAYCCNDDESLAFYLHKAGYDVWLGNNRCGFKPEHTLLEYKDPRMWAWNIRQMGVIDLPAFISKVLHETEFAKLGLVAHSQGTTETFVALARQQRPDLGEKISVFCALAPAVYAGPLIEKMYFKFMRIISPAMFRIFFGIHAFIPLMMTMHSILPARLYGLMGYLVFSFLFDWSDTRWDRGLRDRAFQFAPVYVSSESMRWWLGRECFAKHKCVLSTHEEHAREERRLSGIGNGKHRSSSTSGSDEKAATTDHAWYDERCPPLALWIAGSDKLVDGNRLLQRFKEGREPHARLVHSKVIDEYEHLDVLWAMDSIEKVGSEVKSIIWQTMSDEDRSRCRAVRDVANVVC